VGQNVKGQSVTTSLRALLRHLLAGTNWIMDSSIRKGDAITLIRELLGPDLRKRLGFGDSCSCFRSEHMCCEIKKKSYLHVFAGIPSHLCASKSDGCVLQMLYLLMSDFKSLLSQQKHLFVETKDRTI